MYSSLYLERKDLCIIQYGSPSRESLEFYVLDIDDIFHGETILLC